MTKSKKPTNKDILEEMERDTDAGAIQEEINDEEEARKGGSGSKSEK